MTHTSSRGQLTSWNDDRGFGFIRPENDTYNRHVFIHISALQRMSRRPVVGDIICYDVEDDNGKRRAVRASIEGVPVQNQHSTLRYRSRTSDSAINGAIGMASFVLIVMIGVGVFLFIQSKNPSRTPPILTAITQPDCVIKGNISITSGHQWYHLPGMEDYESTVITPSKGERWFCTEEEAITQGWSKAPK